MTRAWAAGCAVLLASCLEQPPRTIRVESEEEPLDCLETVEERLFPEVDAIIAVAADSSTEHGAWAVVLDDPEPEDPGQRVFLVRYAADGSQAPEPLDLGFVLSQQEQVKLWAGAQPGRAYVLREGSTKADIWIVDAAQGLVASGSLASIPGLGAIDDWDRHVVFMEGRPFVVAVPKVSYTLSLSFYAAELGEDLFSTTVWEMPFIHPCETDSPPPPELCVAEALDRTELRVGATHPIPGGFDTTLLIEKLRIIDDSPAFEVHADISLLQVSLEGGSPAASLLTIPDHADITGDMAPISPLELGFDPAVAWVRADDTLYAVNLLFPGAIRYDAPFGKLGALIQLPQTAVASRVELGEWAVAKHIGRDPLEGGEFEGRVIIPDDVEAVVPAGPGHFLVRWESEESPSFVYLECPNAELDE